jgi:hypothetical protein
LPMARADVVGQGFRCPQCTAKAEVAMLAGGKSDVADHLSEKNRDVLRKQALFFLAIGGVVTALGVILFFAMPFEGFRRHPGTYITSFGATLLVLGSMRSGAAGDR